MQNQSKIVRSELVLSFVCFQAINEKIFRLFEDLKLQFEVEKGQLLDERHNLNVQINQLKEKNSSIEGTIMELNGLLEKQKSCNE